MSEPVIETPRLLLRPPVLGDFEAWAAFTADPATANFLGGVQPRSVAWRGFAGAAGSWALLGFGMFSVIERATGRWVGRVGPWRPDGWPGNEIGWGVVREAWGKGYATESSAAAIDWAIAHLGWTDVIHCIDPANERSKRVATTLGSVLLRMGRMPAPYDAAEVEIWGQTRDAWSARQRTVEVPDPGNHAVSR